jgi:conjugal transfer mating pair stabilization protein TraN
MLPRCRTSYIFVLLVLISSSHADEKLDIYLKQGKSFGRSIENVSLSQKDIEAITPHELKGKTFDGEAALEQLNHISYQNAENYQRGELDPSITAVLENAERKVNLINSDEIVQETIETCRVENTLETITFQRTLNVIVDHQEKTTQTIRTCRGHSSKEKTDNPEWDKRTSKKRFEIDPTIKSYSVKIKKKGLGHRDEVVCKWVHKDNAHTCDSYDEKVIETIPESWKELDIWDSQNVEPIKNLDCILLSTVNGPPATRLINGREVYRPFWTTTQTFQCLTRKSNTCEFLEKNNCILTSEQCLNQIGNQCMVKELTFKCRTRKDILKNDFKKIYGTDENLWETTYSPNTGLSDVATKLAVFDEMKRELQNGDVFDARSVSLFKGNQNACSISIAEDLMYDCCVDMDGLATKWKLSKCTSDEIALAESRRKGLTHYIGSKKEQFLELWTSREEQVYCVFSNKLSRVFQEAARKQLKIDWGSPDKPDCRGLMQEEIKKLDFSKLDLSEALKHPNMPNCQDKIQKIEERLKQRIETT